MNIDAQALERANKNLEEGFFWQAYIVKCLAEDRLAKQERYYTSDDSGCIDSFGARYLDWQSVRGTPDSLDALIRCLNVGIATFSELLAITEGEEHETVARACAKVGSMVQ